MLSYDSWATGPATALEFILAIEGNFPIAWDRGPVHGGLRAVLFLNGNVEIMEEDEFVRRTELVAQILGFRRESRE